MLAQRAPKGDQKTRDQEQHDATECFVSFFLYEDVHSRTDHDARALPDEGLSLDDPTEPTLDQMSKESSIISCFPPRHKGVEELFKI